VLNPLDRQFRKMLMRGALRGIASVIIAVAAYCCGQNSSTPTSSSFGAPAVVAEDGVKPGHLVYRVAPKYPKQALRKKIEGTVELQAVIAKDGSLKELMVISGDPMLASAATEAVQKWRYEPYMLNGEPVEVRTRITVAFTLPNKLVGYPRIPARVDVDTRDSEPLVPLAALPVPEPPPGVYRVGGDVTRPHATYAPDPEFSEEGRKANKQGTVVLLAIVTADGTVRDVRVLQSLGSGLDEKAVEAIKQWKFDPARKNGEPVAVQITATVSFKLYH